MECPAPASGDASLTPQIMSSKTVFLRRHTFPAALLASAILGANASADYHYSTNTTIVSDILLDENERLFLQNGAIVDSVAGSTITSDGPYFPGPRYILESGTLSNITLAGDNDLAKTTSGLVEIDSVQAYTGVTNLEGGTLVLSADNALQSSSSLFIENNAVLDIGQSSQDFQKLIIRDGILDGQSGSFVSAQESFIFENGESRVTLGDSTAPDALPAILVKTGTGTFTLNAQNTYTGGTYILDGTLAMGSTDYAISRASSVNLGTAATWDMSDTSQEVGSLSDLWSSPSYGSTVDLGMTGHLITGFDHSSTTFSGSIIGNSAGLNSVVKTGLGTWTYNGTVHGVAGFSVQQGALFANGYVDASYVGAQKTGVETPVFGGIGHINADYLFATGGGILMPGTQYTPGRLTVGGPGRNGEVFVDVDSTLHIRVGAWHRYGNIVATGHTLLQGNLVVTPWYGYYPTARRSYTLIRSGDGIDNQLQNVHYALPRTMLKPHLRQIDHADGSSELRLSFEQQKFNRVNRLERRHSSLAGSLDKEASGGTINNLVDKLNQIEIDQVPNVIALLSPEQVSAVFGIGFSGARAQFSNIEGRLDTARSGVTGFSTSGLILSDSRGSLNYDGAPITRHGSGLSLAGYDGKSIVAKNTVVPIVEETRWGFFATGAGEWADIESTNLARGSEFTTGGVTLGADYRVSRNLIVGIAGGYANSGSDLWDGGKVTLNSGKGNAYASLFNENSYLNASIGGAYNSIETRRSTLGGMARADANAGEFNTMLGGGYDIHLDNGFTFGPIASLQYTYFNLNQYREHGSDAPLEFPTQSQNSLRSSMGLRAAYGVQWGSIVLTPEVRAQWAHEYLDSTAAVVSKFVGAGSTFRVLGPEIGRDSLVIDAGLSAQLNPNIGFFAYYTGEIGRMNFSSNSINGGFRLSF